MGNPKKTMTNFELEKLMNEVNNNRPLTEDEVNVLLQMFIDEFGTQAWGMSLNPYWLLKKRGQKDESNAVKEWLARDELYEFDEIQVEAPDIGMGVLCKKPKNCSSFQEYGFACRCIRTNFNSRTEFNVWRDKKIKELGNDLLDVLPTEH